MKDALGDRQKKYEGQESDRRFMPLLPICARMDGRSFHSFTKGLRRPYDPYFSKLMIDTTKWLVEETNACIGYTQSDEISLIFYSDTVESQVFFDGRIQKMNSVLASLCSVYFNKLLEKTVDRVYLDNRNNSRLIKIWIQKPKLAPVFDCRAWTVPNQIEACNVLLWREIDATKNSISMAASHYYSDKELFKKNSSDKHEMLHEKGINWNDYPIFFKRGSYIQRRSVKKKFTAEELTKLSPKHEARKNPDLVVERSEVREIEMPPFSKVTNRVEVVFNGKEPKEKNHEEKE